MKVYVGCDHAGLDLKLKVMAALPDLQWQDMGTRLLMIRSIIQITLIRFVKNPCQVENENKKNKFTDSLDGSALGVLICGSGQGMAIRANKYLQIRAALCWNEDIARLSREHNNANIICLSARFTSPDFGDQNDSDFYAV